MIIYSYFEFHSKRFSLAWIILSSVLFAACTYETQVKKTLNIEHVYRQPNNAYWPGEVVMYSKYNGYTPVCTPEQTIGEEKTNKNNLYQSSNIGDVTTSVGGDIKFWLNWIYGLFHGRAHLKLTGGKQLDLNLNIVTISDIENNLPASKCAEDYKIKRDIQPDGKFYLIQTNYMYDVEYMSGISSSFSAVEATGNESIAVHYGRQIAGKKLFVGFYGIPLSTKNFSGDQSAINETYEREASRLLCQVRGDSTPRLIIEEIDGLANKPGSFHNTLTAYVHFLNSPIPDLDLITNNLGINEKSTIYGLRLLGLSSGKLGEKAVQDDESSRAISYYEMAEKYFLEALDKTNKDFPGHPLLVDQLRFKRALKSNIAAIHLGLGMTTSDDRLLNVAKSEYEELRLEFGSVGTYLNLMGIYSLLKEYSNAIKIFSQIKQDTRLTSEDIEIISLDAKNLAKMPELIPFADYVKNNLNTEWVAFVNQRLGEIQKF